MRVTMHAAHPENQIMTDHIRKSEDCQWVKCSTWNILIAVDFRDGLFHVEHLTENTASGSCSTWNNSHRNTQFSPDPDETMDFSL